MSQGGLSGVVFDTMFLYQATANLAGPAAELLRPARGRAVCPLCERRDPRRSTRCLGPTEAQGQEPARYRRNGPGDL